MRMKSLCTIDPRVGDRYIYDANNRFPLSSAKQLMNEMHEFRVKMGHEPGQYRPIYAHEFKEYQPSEPRKRKSRKVNENE